MNANYALLAAVFLQSLPRVGATGDDAAAPKRRLGLAARLVQGITSVLTGFGFTA